MSHHELLEVEQKYTLVQLRELIEWMRVHGHPGWGLDRVRYADLASRTCLTKSYINNIVNRKGRNQDIGSAMLLTFCDQIGLDRSYFSEARVGKGPAAPIWLFERQPQRTQDKLVEQVSVLMEQVRELAAEIKALKREQGERDAGMIRAVVHSESVKK